MADYPLISSYITAFDAVISSRTDAADLRDEVHDHLLTAVERWCARGLDTETAERRSLDIFGDPAVIAGMISAVPVKGSPMNTFFTRAAAYFGFSAAALWIAAAAALPFAMDTDGWSASQGAYLTASALVAVAIALSGLVLLAVHVRSAGRFDASATVTAALLLVSFLAALIFAWFWVAWLGLLLAATLVTFLRRSNSHLTRGLPRVLLVVVWPILAVGTLVLASVAAQWDPRTSGTVQAVALATLCLTYGLGIAALGLRQRAASSAGSNRHPLMTA
ncbi:permease prefix domain 1-containing protein [Cryobacterium sp. CG_9.6]|uniref:permease prefix domain 1-containing protein n=1 Tax=Cryobacterium sp. CG_9.6 TaxID=2760710 RepID=UPI002475AFC6|nr:permease prefix domain 1-containing protein [Cryobacterium sp. CG_9.6]MDH6236873.1 hypothetical protein [Cryobacterium sp. CG_9.6]